MPAAAEDFEELHARLRSATPRDAGPPNRLRIALHSAKGLKAMDHDLATKKLHERGKRSDPRMRFFVGRKEITSRVIKHSQDPVRGPRGRSPSTRAEGSGRRSGGRCSRSW